MKVLVLGGTRFIGRAIVQRLLREGHEVTLLNRGLSNDPFGTRVRRILGDRRNHETIVSAADKRDFDALIDITAYHETETSTVVETFRDRIGHFIHISTVSVYLIRDGIFPPYREDHFAGALVSKKKSEESSWFYSLHKRRCEEVLEQAWQEHRFPYTSYRLPMIVGPHDYTARADAYLGRLLSGGPIILPEGGLNAWGFLWVEDVAKVIASNLGNQASVGHAYNLAQREALSLRQLIETAASMLGRQPQIVSLPSAWLEAVGVGTSFSPYSHDQDILLDCRRAERDLLFKPTPTLTWVEDLVKDFRQRWDGVLRAFATTRSYELSLVQELNKIRLPAFNVRQ
jgi:nucleoside-diphosphate-sugar epimerase